MPSRQWIVRPWGERAPVARRLSLMTAHTANAISATGINGTASSTNKPPRPAIAISGNRTTPASNPNNDFIRTNGRTTSQASRRRGRKQAEHHFERQQNHTTTPSATNPSSSLIVVASPQTWIAH